MTNILDLTPDDARKFFLNQKSYCNIGLPDYFDFQPLLNALASDFMSAMASSSLRYENCLRGFSKDRADEVNCQIYANKDGEFAWRRLQLLNPIAYIYLVFQITDKKNWKIIVNRFNDFKKNDKIKCCSIPVSIMESNSKSENVSNWWHENEQESLKLAMKYTYMMVTDISDCYGSIYTHSIPWALYGKPYAKKNRSNHMLIGNQIDATIRSISYGQTNGIPQGSVLMDFIAEMVLGYADMCLYEVLKREKINDYYILRYRDDYRIFANEKEDIVKIARVLDDILAELSLKLNTSKTAISDNIICDSVKLDKLSWMEKNEPNTVQKRLLAIHRFSSDFPNSGSVEKGLCKIADDIEDDVTVLSNENLDVIFSILVDIAFRNPRAYSVVVVILGKILPILSKGQIKELFDQIDRKFKRIPNTEFMSIWLQRLTMKVGLRRRYDSKICVYVQQIKSKYKKVDIIWKCNGFSKIFQSNPVVDLNRIVSMPQIPDTKEVKLFWHY